MTISVVAFFVGFWAKTRKFSYADYSKRIGGKIRQPSVAFRLTGLERADTTWSVENTESTSFVELENHLLTK